MCKAGKHFTLDDVTILPKPVQKPHPPVWVTVMRSPASFRYAAERRYGVISGNPYQHDPEFREAFFGYQEVMQELGVAAKAQDFWGLSPTFVDEDDKRATRIPRESWEAYDRALGKYGTPKQADGSLPKDYALYGDFGNLSEPEDLRKPPSYLVGNPEMVIEKLKKLEQEGMTNFILWMNRGGGISQKDVLSSMELFAKKVMPAFTEEKAGGKKS